MHTIEEIEIQEICVWMDGGSVSVRCITPRIQESVTIEFHQNTILAISPDGKIPGRIYINNVMVNLRSELENKILSLIEKNIKSGKFNFSSSEKSILLEKISYIKSEKYITNNEGIHKMLHMDSRQIYIKGQRLKHSAIWPRLGDSEWECIDPDQIFTILAAYFGEHDLYLIRGRENSMLCDATGMHAQIAAILYHEDFTIWNPLFRKVLEFNKVGVFRRGYIA